MFLIFEILQNKGLKCVFETLYFAFSFFSSFFFELNLLTPSSSKITITFIALTRAYIDVGRNYNHDKFSFSYIVRNRFGFDPSGSLVKVLVEDFFYNE